jgi:hypothetical protein
LIDIMPSHYPKIAAGLALSLLPLLTVCLPVAAVAQTAASAADVFRKLAADTWISRSVGFSELGFKGPMVLASTDTKREIYLPVPANVPLADASLQLDANYLRADGGRTTMIVSLDNYPVSARAFTLEKGDAGIPLGVDGAARPGGFVHLGVNWATALSRETICADSRAPGNILRIEPSSRFTYRYDGAAIRDLATAWGALPASTSILVAGRSLSAESYDSAWRLGVALERNGKRSTIKLLPAVGDVVDLEGIAVAPALLGIPAFAALAAGGKHKMKDAAEIGALLSLGQNGLFRADIIVADPAMIAGLGAAFDALDAQLKTAAPDAVAAFAEWRARIEPAAKIMGPMEVRLGSAFGRPAILIAPDAGAKAAGLFGEFWRGISVSPALAVQTIDRPRSDGAIVTLKNLGGAPGSFDVLGRAEWTASFDLEAVSADGRRPSTLLLDVSAAPGAARASPVASVFLNDILLGAKHLDATGRRERITARIPRHVLAARNVVKVSFVRQLSSDGCRETPEAYPVAVLATSHLLLDKAEPEANFTGMLSRFAAGADLMLPKAYLSDAGTTLPRVIRLAASTGVPATNAALSLVEAGKEQNPHASFLAIDVPINGGQALVKVDGGRLVLGDRSKRTLLDISGLDRVGILEMAQSDGKSGIVYRTVGATPPPMDSVWQLSRGNFAAIGPRGLLTELDTENASGHDLIDDDEQFSLRKTLWWGLPIVLIALFIALMIRASRARRRHAAAKREQ